MGYLTTQIGNLIAVAFPRSNQGYKATFYNRKDDKQISVTYLQSDSLEHNVTGIQQAQEIIGEQGNKDLYFKLEPIRVSRKSSGSKGQNDRKVSQAAQGPFLQGKDTISSTQGIPSPASTMKPKAEREKKGILNFPNPPENPTPFQEHIHAAQNDEHAEEMYRILLIDLFEEREELLKGLKNIPADELTDTQRERMKELVLEIRIIEREFNNINPSATKERSALSKFKKSGKHFDDLNPRERKLVAKHYGNEPPVPADEIPYEKISKEERRTGKPDRKVQFSEEETIKHFYIGAPPSTGYPERERKATNRSRD
ncbi:MAG TPA: hypothetical protein DCE71_07040, partial [Parachlamydiales bacterium]|nr:hypothetical protein [Parachlamydiales bacterium]